MSVVRSVKHFQNVWNCNIGQKLFFYFIEFDSDRIVQLDWLKESVRLSNGTLDDLDLECRKIFICRFTQILNS